MRDPIASLPTVMALRALPFLVLAFLVAAPPAAAAVQLRTDERIVFESTRENGVKDLFSVAEGGLQLRNLTRTPEFDEANIRASRDGRWLTFGREEFRSKHLADIYVMRNDGSGLRQVT